MVKVTSREYLTGNKTTDNKNNWPLCLPLVNFINVKRAKFLYERHFGSFFSSYMYVVKAAETTFVQKIRTCNVDEIDTLSLKGTTSNHSEKNVILT